MIRKLYEKNSEIKLVMAGNIFRMKIFMLAAFLLAAFILTSAVSSGDAAAINRPEKELTLAESIDLALEQNQGFKAAREELKKQEATLSMARAARRPELTLSSSYARFDDDFGAGGGLAEELGFELNGGAESRHTTDLNLQQPLFTFGRISGRIESSEAALRAGEAGYAGERQDLIHEVIILYHNLILSEEAVRVQKDYLRAIESHKEVVEANLEAGLITRLDLYEVRVALSEIEQKLIEAESDLKLARSRFSSLLGLPAAVRPTAALKPGDRFENLEDELLLLGEEDIIDLSENFQLENLSHRLQASEARTEAARAERYPTIGLSGNYSREDDGFGFDESSWSAAVGLSLNLFDGGQRKAEIEQAVSEMRQLDHLRLDMDSRLQVEARRALSALSDARARQKLAREMRREATERVKLAELRYSAGVGTGTDVLDARAEKSRALLTGSQTDFRRVEAAADMYRVLGRIDKIYEEVR